MSDRAEVVKITPVFADPGPERCVLVLEDCGGDLSKFVDLCEWYSNKPTEWVIATVERALRAAHDKTLYRRWQDAIKSNQVTRLRLLQNRAIDRLEALAKLTEGDLSIGWSLMAKEASAHKMVLGDLFAAQTFAAKQRAPVIEEDGDDDDEAELAQIMDGA